LGTRTETVAVEIIKTGKNTATSHAEVRCTPGKLRRKKTRDPGVRKYLDQAT